MDKLKIRSMEERDLDEVCAIEEEAFSVPWSKKSFQDALMLPHVLFLTAEYKGSIAGYCGFYQSLEEAEITNVAVKKELRGRGIGRELLKGLLAAGEARGASVYFLEVRAGNEAATRLYEGQGFERLGLRRNFYERPTEDAVIMRKQFPAS